MGALITQSTQGTAWAALGAIFLFIFLIPCAIAFGLSIYFLTIVAKFYAEIAKGAMPGQQQGMVLQPYNTPQMVQKGDGVAPVYIPPGVQNAGDQYPEKAPTGVESVTYHYPQQTPDSPFMQQSYQSGIKSPA